MRKLEKMFFLVKGNVIRNRQALREEKKKKKKKKKT